MFLRLLPLVSFFSFAAASPPSAPEDHVNTLAGTHSRYGLSRGNVVPDVALPWGFNGFAPLTSTADGAWWFHSDDFQLHGIRLTHQPSPWMGDWGWLRLGGGLSDGRERGGGTSAFSSYDPRAATFRPYLFNATLTPYGTAHGAATIEARTVEDAIAALSLAGAGGEMPAGALSPSAAKAAEDAADDAHPERRMKAAFKRFQDEHMPAIKAEYHGCAVSRHGRWTSPRGRPMPAAHRLD